MLDREVSLFFEASFEIDFPYQGKEETLLVSPTWEVILSIETPSHLGKPQLTFTIYLSSVVLEVSDTFPSSLTEKVNSHLISLLDSTDFINKHVREEVQKILLQELTEENPHNFTQDSFMLTTIH